MRINISIDDVLLKDFDEYCDKRRYNRSELLSKLMRDVVYGVTSIKDREVFLRKPTGEIFNPDEKIIATDRPEITPQDLLEENVLMGWCEINRAHPFMKGKEFPIKKFTYEDENGNPVVMEKWGCPECIKYFENKGLGRVYYMGP